MCIHMMKIFGNLLKNFKMRMTYIIHITNIIILKESEWTLKHLQQLIDPHVLQVAPVQVAVALASRLLCISLLSQQ